MANENKTLWYQFWNERLAVSQRTLFGTVLVFLLVLLVIWVGINETRRMETFTEQFEARSIQRGASIFAGSCSSCHGVDGRGIEGIAPSLNDPEMFDGTRLEQNGYNGSLESYIELTVAAGRPVRSADWPSPMPTWSQEFGGPMRPDEVRDVTRFILNWGCQYDDTCIEPADAEALALPEGGAAPDEEETPESAQPDRTLDEIVADLPEGDTSSGEALFTSLACNACHSTGSDKIVGPGLAGVSDRKPEGYESIEHYLVESIWYPDAYYVPGFESGGMLSNFMDRTSDQDLADLIAYLMTLD